MQINLDKEMIEKKITAFRELYDREPYMICSKETYDMLPESTYEAINAKFLSSYGIAMCNTKEIENENKQFMYNPCKVFIDDDLKIGNIIFG